MNDLVVVTVATHSEGYFDSLKLACENNQIRFVVLGWGQKWQGYAWKFKLMRDFLSGESGEQSIYTFVDGFDVLPAFNKSSTEALKAYKSLADDKVLVGINFPPKNFTEHVQAWLDRAIFGTCVTESVELSLNSGVYAGPKSKLIQLLDLCSTKSEGNGNNDDDQRLLLRACNSEKSWFRDNVVFDTGAKFALNVTCAISANSKQHLLSSARSYPPPFLHGAGNCNMDLVAAELQLLPAKRISNSKRNTLKRVFSRDGYARYAIKSPEIVSLLILFLAVIVLILLRLRRSKI